MDAVTLYIKTITMPVDYNLNDEVRSGDENALKYFMVSKAYEKESDLENFQKSQYFFSVYQRELSMLLKGSKLGYVKKTELTRGYYF